MTPLRRQSHRSAALLSLALGAAASCRAYELCDEGRSCGAPAPSAPGASGASGGEQGGVGTAGAGNGPAPSGGNGATPSRGGGSGTGNPGGDGGEPPARDAGAAGESAAGGDAGASGPSDGGNGGEGGTGELECVAPDLNCDGSTLNGCETNVIESVRHCGACDQECAGLCMRGACLKFDVMAPDQSVPEADVALAPDYAYFAAYDDGELQRRLRRVSRWTGELETLSPSWEWPQIRSIAVGSLRLYVSDGQKLVSLEFDGSDALDEGLANVNAIAASAGYVYYSSLTSLYRWSETSRESELVRTFEGAASLELAASDAGLFVTVNYPYTLEPPRYELHFAAPPAALELFDSGRGRADFLTASFTDAYFIVRGAEAVELRHVFARKRAALLEADALDIVDLAAGSGVVYATFVRASGGGLRLYTSMGSPLVLEWRTRGYLLRPISTPTRELWAVDSSQAALTRFNPFDGLGP